MKEEQIILEEEHEGYGPWGAEGVPEPVMRLVADWFVRAYDKYFQSKHYRDLDATAQRYAYAITRSFTMMMLVDAGETPREWSKQGIEFAFDELLPHDVQQTRDYEQHFAPVTLSFLNWLAANKALPQAQQLADQVKTFLPVAAERCDCGIRNEPLDIAERIMSDSNLDSNSLLNRAVFIAKYTETICGEIEKSQERTHEPRDKQTLELDLTCPCGSGKKFDECCGGVN